LYTFASIALITYPLALTAITAFAEKLNVPLSVASTFRHRNDVVKFQLLSATTLNASALVASPHEYLNCFGDTLALCRRDAFVEVLESGHLCFHPLVPLLALKEPMLDANKDLFRSVVWIVAVHAERHMFVDPDIRP